MLEPPAILDSSQVLLFAILDSSVTYTGRATLYVGIPGKIIDPVPRLAITRNLYDEGILLCHCDDDWNVLGVSGHASVDEAQHTAEKVYNGVTTKWKAFRELSADEVAAVEAQREWFQKYKSELNES